VFASLVRRKERGLQRRQLPGPEFTTALWVKRCSLSVEEQRTVEDTPQQPRK